MISIDLIRNDLEHLSSALLARGHSDDLNEVVNLDRLHRKSLSRVNELRAERNKVSDQIAEIKKTGGNADNEIRSMREVGENIKKIENDLANTCLLYTSPSPRD